MRDKWLFVFFNLVEKILFVAMYIGLIEDKLETIEIIIIIVFRLGCLVGEALMFPDDDE